MYECWIYKDEPKVRLVVKSGAMLPTELGHKDWTLLGPYEPSPDTTHEVDRRGYHFFETDEPLPAPERLKDAAASGN